MSSLLALTGLLTESICRSGSKTNALFTSNFSQEQLISYVGSLAHALSWNLFAFALPACHLLHQSVGLDRLQTPQRGSSVTCQDGHQ